MSLENIISVQGKSGLFEIVSKSKLNILIKDLETGKKTTISTQTNVILISNITVFTDNEEDIKIQQIFVSIYNKEKEGDIVSYKDEASTLFEYFSHVLPTFDRKRVYHSDLKKIFRWYEILKSNNIIEELVENSLKPESLEE